MEFVVIGKLNKTHQEIEKTIRKMGGKVVSVIHKELAAVISNPEEVQRMGVQIKMAKRHNIPVVPEDFLAEVSKGTDPIFYIISESLCDWGGDVRIKLIIYSLLSFILITEFLSLCIAIRTYQAK